MKFISWNVNGLRACMGKGFLFRMFFGWRESNEKGCVYILSKRAWRELEGFIKELL